MTPDPKPESLRYDKYTKWVRKQRSSHSGYHGVKGDPVVNCHMRCMKDAGTAIKPSDFQQLPALNSEHLHDHQKGGIFTIEVASDKILAHNVGYLMEHATPYQKLQVSNLIGNYIKENGI